MAKWGITDGFWQLRCAKGDEWSFIYVLLEHERLSTKLVLSNVLHQGNKPPQYFYTPSKT
jgi:hypothetical protein